MLAQAACIVVHGEKCGAAGQQGRVGGDLPLHSHHGADCKA